jgi:hypothetical protein
MGVRGELFSTRIILPNRTYFFNVKENRMGDLYLNIVESKNKETGGFDRQSVILFADDLQHFLKGFDESLKVMEKAVREKRHGAPAGREEKPFRKERPDNEGKPFHRERPNRDGKDRGNFSGERKGRSERGGDRQHSPGNKFQKNFNKDRGHDHKPEGGRREGGKRVVVRKHDKR